MITDSSSLSVMADTQVIVRLQAEDAVPGSLEGSGITPGPEGGMVPGRWRDVPGPASGVDRCGSRAPAAVVIRAGPGRETAGRVGRVASVRASGVISPAGAPRSARWPLWPGQSLFSLAWARCRLAAAASPPGPGGISAPHRGNAGAGWVFSPPASGHGPGGAEIVVPFQLRPAGRGIAADGSAGGTAGSHRGAAGPRGPGESCVPVPRYDLAGGPEPGVGLLASGAG
jgi:hypothetical protein